MKKIRLVIASILALVGLVGCSEVNNHVIDANDLKVTSVSLDISYQKMAIGETITLTPKISYQGDEEVEVYKEWKSSNSRVASVSETGMVAALKAGRAAITFIAGYKSASCSIEVLGNDIYIDPTSSEEGGEEIPGEFRITLNTTSITLKTGNSYQLNATTTEEASVSWSSSNEAVATVTQNGLVNAISEGSATIHATSNGKSVSCEVTVSDEQADIEHDDDMTVHIYFFLDYNNADEDDTTGKKLLTHFWWYEDQPIANSGKVPANPTTSPTPDFPYFAGWSVHPIIDSKDKLLDLTTYKVEDEGSRQFLYIYGIWTDVQGGMTK